MNISPAAVPPCWNTVLSYLYFINKLIVTGFECLFLFSFQDVNLSDSFGRSALHNAVLKGIPGIVRIVLDANADVNIKDDRGDSPLHYSARTGHPDILKVQ